METERKSALQPVPSALLTLLHLCERRPGSWSTRRLFDDQEQQAASLVSSSPSLSPTSLALSLNSFSFHSTPHRSPALTSGVGRAVFTKSFGEKSMATGTERASVSLHMSGKPPFNC